MGKKNPYVFTIGFDRRNPDHVEAAELLNQTDKKAALIAEALLQYTGKRVSAETGVTQEGIQAMVRLQIQQELKKLMQDLAIPDTLIGQEPVTEPVQDLSEPEDILLDEDKMKSVADAMAAFRKL